jgi:hypothetical protein
MLVGHAGNFLFSEFGFRVYVLLFVRSFLNLGIYEFVLFNLQIQGYTNSCCLEVVLFFGLIILSFNIQVILILDLGTIFSFLENGCTCLFLRGRYAFYGLKIILIDPSQT